MNRLGILVFIVSLTLATKAYDSSLPAARTPGALPPYVPEAGDVMDSIQLHHAKLWFAGTGGNWPLAEYELNEIKEDFQVLATYRSAIKEKQIAAMIDTVMVTPIANVASAVSTKDRAAFEKAFDNLTATCNSCHQGAGYPFISITRPSAPPVTNQRFDE